MSDYDHKKRHKRDRNRRRSRYTAVVTPSTQHAVILSHVTDQDHVIVTEAVDTIGMITVETETGIETEET